MRSILLTDEEFTTLSHAIKVSLAKSTITRDKYTALIPADGTEEAAEISFLLAMFELSVLQQSNALAALSPPSPQKHLAIPCCANKTL